MRFSNANPETILYVSPSTTTVHVGETFSVNVSVQDVLDLYAFYFILKFNATVLDALIAHVHWPFNTGPAVSPIIGDDFVEVSGIIGYSGPGVSGNFPIASITFNATAFGDSMLDLYDAELKDSTLNPITPIIVDGTVYVTDGVHDVAVTSVVPFKTIIGQGYTMNIKVAVANQGDFNETFSVTLYANTTEIETKEITLENGTSTTLTFLWNTTGLPKGNYTIWAYAWPVQNETNIANNTLTGRTVYVSAPGDINGDTHVNVKDATILGAAFGSKLGNPDWNPNADIDNDGYINVKDATILGVNFGQNL
ncbi:MAG: dockerin type I domain-containing protein [Candidatus Bathyarchaeia archaeon]